MRKWIFLAGSLLLAVGYIAYTNSKQISRYVATRTSPPKEEKTKPLLFMGDIMLGRHVETLAVQSGDELRSFRLISNFLKGHVTIVNLEGPIPEKHVHTPNNGFSFSFPSSTPRVLKEGGITAVSLANNHMFDHGRSGWESTKQALDREGIFYFGGYSPAEADYFETKLGTTTVIVCGVTMIATGWDEDQAVSVAAKLRTEHPDAYLIAFLHWGDEYVTQNRYQRAFAHRLIESGTDAIIGAHPHVVQGVEVYKGKPIFYSLGNFIFDQYWRDDLEDGYILKLSNVESAYVYELIPIRSVRSIPQIASTEERDAILKNIANQSPETLKPFLLKGFLSLPE